MNAKLTPHSEDLLCEYLARGGYRTPERVIERALENLADRNSLAPPHCGHEARTSIPELQALGSRSGAVWTRKSTWTANVLHGVDRVFSRHRYILLQDALESRTGSCHV